MKNPTDAPAHPDSAEPARSWQDLAAGSGIFLPVIAIAVIVAASSYYHEFELAHRNGQPRWVSAALPFTVDGLVLAAAIAILWGLAHGIRHPPRPLAALAVGAAVTVAANVFSEISAWWLRPAVSGWAGVAALLVGDVGMWWINERRKLADPDAADGPPPAPCSCPPVPLTLAELIPLARAELRDRGEKYGEEELAARFETTRHKIRAIPTAGAPQTPAGTGTIPPVRAVPAGLNGSGSHD